MLPLFVPEKTFFDDDNEEFVVVDSVTLKLEHSLISLSKWEEEYKRPFLKPNDEKTREELIAYVRYMTVSPKNVSDLIYASLSTEELNKIFEYVNETRSATTINRQNQKRNSELITSELIYFWMFSYQIPKECEQWHLSRLLLLIEIFSVKNQPEKKMNHREWATKANALNKARRAKARSRG